MSQLLDFSDGLVGPGDGARKPVLIEGYSTASQPTGREMSGNGGVLLDGWRMVVLVGRINDDNTYCWGCGRRREMRPDDTDSLRTNTR